MSDEKFARNVLPIPDVTRAGLITYRHTPETNR